MEESENHFIHILDREDYENKNSWEITYEEDKGHSTKKPQNSTLDTTNTLEEPKNFILVRK